METAHLSKLWLKNLSKKFLFLDGTQTPDDNPLTTFKKSILIKNFSLDIIFNSIELQIDVKEYQKDWNDFFAKKTQSTNLDTNTIRFFHKLSQWLNWNWRRVSFQPKCPDERVSFYIHFWKIKEVRFLKLIRIKAAIIFLSSQNVRDYYSVNISNAMQSKMFLPDLLLKQGLDIWRKMLKKSRLSR